MPLGPTSIHAAEGGLSGRLRDVALVPQVTREATLLQVDGGDRERQQLARETPEPRAGQPHWGQGGLTAPCLDEDACREVAITLSHSEHQQHGGSSQPPLGRLCPTKTPWGTERTARPPPRPLPRAGSPTVQLRPASDKHCTQACWLRGRDFCPWEGLRALPIQSHIKPGPG